MDGSVTALNCNFNTSLADCKETTKSIETPNLSGNSYLLNVFFKMDTCGVFLSIGEE